LSPSLNFKKYLYLQKDKNKQKIIEEEKIFYCNENKGAEYATGCGLQLYKLPTQLLNILFCCEGPRAALIESEIKLCVLYSCGMARPRSVESSPKTSFLLTKSKSPQCSMFLFNSTLLQRQELGLTKTVDFGDTLSRFWTQKSKIRTSRFRVCRFFDLNCGGLDSHTFDGFNCLETKQNNKLFSTSLTRKYAYVRPTTKNQPFFSYFEDFFPEI